VSKDVGSWSATNCTAFEQHSMERPPRSVYLQRDRRRYSRTMTKKLAIGLASALALLGACALSAGFIADAWMARWIDTALSQAPFTKASHGAVRYALWQGRLAIDDLSFETSLPALRWLRAEHLEFDGVGLLLGRSRGDLRLTAVRGQKIEAANDDFRQS